MTKEKKENTQKYYWSYFPMQATYYVGYVCFDKKGVPIPDPILGEFGIPKLKKRETVAALIGGFYCSDKDYISQSDFQNAMVDQKFQLEKDNFENLKPRDEWYAIKTDEEVRYAQTFLNTYVQKIVPYSPFKLGYMTPKEFEGDLESIRALNNNVLANAKK